jgi:hypothetical protein
MFNRPDQAQINRTFTNGILQYHSRENSHGNKPPSLGSEDVPKAGRIMFHATVKYTPD